MHAVIDLGTNTFHLLIAKVAGNELQTDFSLQVPVKLGEGGIEHGHITDAAINRAFTALEKFKHYIDLFEISKVTALATSAIRDAKNGNYFIQLVEEKLSIKIEAISGDEEAEYIYNGVKHSFNFLDENVLVMDIGGGSVEFIVGKKNSILFKTSLNIGAARLIALMPHSNPITDAEINRIIEYVNPFLKELKGFTYEHPVRTLVGSAGSFETLVDIVLKDFQTIPVALSKHAYHIHNNLFELFYELIITSTAENRSKLKGMAGFRIEMIVVATVLMNFIRKEFNIEKIICSDYSLKEGIIFTK